MSTATFEKTVLNVPYRALVISVLAHLIIPFILIIVQLLDLWNIRFIPTQKTKRQVYQSFIQVDLVALPDALQEDKIVDPTLPIVKDPKTTTKPKVQKSIPKDAMTLTKKKKKISKAKLKKAKAKQRSEALRKLREESKRDNALKELEKLAQTRSAGRSTIKGNRLSKGTATMGNIGTAKNRYQERVTQAIKEHFYILPVHQGKKLISIIHITILPSGKVTRIRPVQSSGVASYDRIVVQAITQASTKGLPLPRDLSLLKGGITIEFRPED